MADQKEQHDGRKDASVPVSEEEYALALADCEQKLAQAQAALGDARKTISKLRTQVGYLQRENAQYRQKLAKITDTWYGRLAIKGYHLLQKIKRSLAGGGKGR